MRRVVVIAGSAALLITGLAAIPYAPSRQASTARVMVHCPNGDQPAFVTPARVTIAVGDSVEWRMTGQVASDSLIISLKNSEQVWPFTGGLPKGTNSARTGRAQVPGTYGYNVDLQCRMPGGDTQDVRIDPDIIIE